MANDLPYFIFLRAGGPGRLLSLMNCKEVGGKVVRIRRVCHALQHVFEFQQLGGKLFFQRFGQNGWCGCVPFAGFAEHALHTSVSVLQVGGGVAFKREHGVPVEHIIAGAVFAQVGVFNRTDADGFDNFSG